MDKNKMRENIIANGCYGSRENERIYDKWFSTGPRYLFRTANKKYKLTDRSICDAGCGFGMNLAFYNSDSYGIEISSYEYNFAKSIGLKVYNRDMVKDDLSDLPKVDSVWSCAVLEHVESPHIMLRKMWGLLKNDGLLLMYVPNIPMFTWLRYLPYLGKHFRGYLHGDHINAFTPKTIKFFCERAGFKTIEVSPCYPGIFSIFNKTFNVMAGSMYVGRKNEAWEYSSDSSRQKANNSRGFKYKSNE